MSSTHLPFRKALYIPDGSFRDEIAKIIVQPLDSDWFKQLENLSQIGYLTNVRNFMAWFYKAKFNSSSKLDILNLFQEFRVNVSEVKSGNTGVQIIKSLVNKYLELNTSIPKPIRTLCNLIIQRHRPLPKHAIKQTSLSSWFTQLPWLRYEMDDRDYSLLGKPRILSESFIYTIATILFEIIEHKKKLKYAIDALNKKIRFEVYKNSTEMKSKRKLFLKQLFERIIQDQKFDDPVVYELFLMDCIVDDTNRLQIQEIIDKKSLTFQEKKRLVAAVNRLIFNRPNILAPRDAHPHSIFEENLFSFICAWLAIQPYDIKKLKKSHFTTISDETGRPYLIKTSYFKGRSGAVHEPPTISPDSIIGKAILSYLSGFQENDQLFSIGYAYMNNLTFGAHSNTKLLALCIESSYFSSKINKQLKLNSATDIFSKAYLVLYRNHDLTFTNWTNLRKRENLAHGKIKLYKTEVKKWLPQGLFTLGAIKNTSVHAKSDKFRINDPINENSHTSSTEYENYLTDSNKEWMNVNGAVTRLVLQKVGAAFNLDLKLHTSIVSSKLVQTKFEKDFVSSFNDEISKSTSANSADLILKNLVVLDTPETVMFMKHYIAQVISKMHSLVARNLEFFEFTALPTAEWMETILATKLSPKVVLEGYKRYESFKTLLPDLFTNYIYAGDMN